MYGIFTNICPKTHPNVGKYTIDGSYGYLSIYPSIHPSIFLSIDRSIINYLSNRRQILSVRWPFLRIFPCRGSWDVLEWPLVMTSSLQWYRSAQFRARADEVRGESLQFKRGELIKFRKRGGQKLLSKHVQRVGKKNFSGSRKLFLFPSEWKK